MTRIDAIVPASALTLDLARELEQLAPFGLGNPDVTLLVAGCEAVGPATVGEGKHLRFRVRQHGRDAGQCDRLRSRRPARAAAGGRPLRRRVQAQAEPLERHGRPAARRAPRLRYLGWHTRSYGRGWPSSGAPESRRGRRRRGGSSVSSRSTARAASGSCSNRRRSGRCSSTATRSRCLEPPELSSRLGAIWWWNDCGSASTNQNGWVGPSTRQHARSPAQHPCPSARS